MPWNLLHLLAGDLLLRELFCNFERLISVISRRIYITLLRSIINNILSLFCLRSI